MALKMDYQDDVFPNKRKYRLVANADGTTSFDDVTAYTQVGTVYGANDINATNKLVNSMDNIMEITIPINSWSNSAPYKAEIAVAKLKATDTITLGLAGDKSTAAATLKVWHKMSSYITAGEALDGKIALYCAHKKPSSEFNIKIKGVSV